MKDSIQTIATGVMGAGAVELADKIPTADEVQNYGQLLIQLIIGIFTIVKMFKKKKKNAVPDQAEDQ